MSPPAADPQDYAGLLAPQARPAILQHLDELEDLYLAERALARIRSGEDKPIPLEEVMKRHGLED